MNKKIFKKYLKETSGFCDCEIERITKSATNIYLRKNGTVSFKFPLSQQ